MTARPDPQRAYVPGLLRRWLEDTPDVTCRTVDGTLVFVDVSGFTQLSERLARVGRLGAEELTDTIDRCFSALLEVAYAAGGTLLKFGGDALLLLFTGEDHAARGCRAAVGMRAALDEVGDLRTSAGNVRLRMSVGVHRDTVHFFLVGDTHRELIVTGPAASETVAAEGAADSGEIVVSSCTAEVLPPDLLGPERGAGYLLLGAPEAADEATDPASGHTDADLLSAIPVALRDHVLADRHDAEHRRVTVAFLRFSGTDGRITADGPDATAQALHALVCEVQRAVDRHAVSFLATDIDADGGKIVLTAGAPSSGGNDEERMLVALRDLTVVGLPFSLRVGVHAGHVFAGDIGPHYRRTYTVMGDAVNLAARVMGRAEPGQIVATAETLAASRTTFDTTDLEPFQVKGKSDPVEAAIVGPSLGVRTSERDAELPFIGREEELAAFDGVMEAARDGSGRLVELTGEAGIGKSRLLAAFRTRADGAALHHLECELHRATTPYGTIRKLLREVLDVPADADDTEAGERLLATLRAELPDLVEWAPLLAIALGTELPATESTANLDERFIRPRLHETMLELLSWCWRGPVLVTVEDAQWLDEASADALRAIAGKLAERPWVLCVARREHDPATPEETPCLTLALEPLDPDATVALASAATDASPLAPHDMAALVERSGGNPLFLQELVAAVREAGGVEALPDSVGSLVTARIDRLPPLQRGALREVSVLGFSFPRDLAAAVLTDGDPSELDQLTDFLVDEGASVRFRHAIIREVAYEGLPYRRRRQLHAVAGDTIADTGGDQPELLSFHYHLAGRCQEAWDASCTAGDRAATVYANVDAARFYERALESAGRLGRLEPAEVARVAEALGDARQRLGDVAKAGDAYREAARAVRDDPVAWAGLQLKQARVKAQLKRYSPALATITRALRQLEGVDGETARAQRAQLMVWYGHFREEQGRHSDAIQWSQRAIEEASAVEEFDALAHAYRLLDWAHVERGEPELAVHSSQAIELYEELGDLPSLASTLNNVGGIMYWQGDWVGALHHYERASELDEQTGDVLGAAVGRNNIAEILADQGRWDEAEELFRAAERVFRAAGIRSVLAFAKANLGRTAARAGRHVDARQLLEEAREISLEIGAQTLLAEVEARLAELEVLRGQPEQALAAAERTLERNETEDGVAAQGPLLHRVRGYALAQQGQLAAAREALARSLSAAQQRDADYERALTERALAEIAALEAGEPDQRLLRNSAETLERLGVKRLPTVPLHPIEPDEPVPVESVSA